MLAKLWLWGLAVLIGFSLACAEEGNPRKHSSTSKKGLDSREEDSSDRDFDDDEKDLEDEDDRDSRDSSDDFDDERPSTRSSSKSKTGSTKSTSKSGADPQAANSPGAGGSAGAATSSGARTLDQKYAAMCQEVAALTLPANVTAEVGIFCKGGQPTGNFKKYAASAYDGTTAKQVPPIILRSQGNQTEVQAAGAVKFPRSIPQLNANRSNAMNMTVRTEGTSIVDNELTQQKPGSSPNEQVQTFERNITSRVAIVTLEDRLVIEDHTFLFDDEELGFNYQILKAGEADNEDNPIFISVGFMVQDTPKASYGFSLVHQSVDNKGFAGVAEERIPQQAPALQKATYDALVK